MTSVRVHTLILSDAEDLADSMVFPLMSRLSAAPQVFGENRSYSSGRVRAINRLGKVQRLTATLPACTRTQVVWIESHMGRLLLVRDDRGRKFYGNYREPTVDEHRYNREADVGLTLSQVTRTEAV